MQTATMELILSLNLIDSELKEVPAATALDNKNIVCLHFGKHERLNKIPDYPMDPIGFDCIKFEWHLKQEFYPAARGQGVEIIYVSGDVNDRKKKMEEVVESCLEWDNRPEMPLKKIPGFYGFKIKDLTPLYGALTEDYQLFDGVKKASGFTYPRFVVLKKDGTLISKNAADEVLAKNSVELIQEWKTK